MPPASLGVRQQLAQRRQQARQVHEVFVWEGGPAGLGALQPQGKGGVGPSTLTASLPQDQRLKPGLPQRTARQARQARHGAAAQRGGVGARLAGRLHASTPAARAPAKACQE